MMPRTPIDTDELLSMYRSGTPTKQIAAHFGCNYTVINRRLRELGEPVRRNMPPMSDGHKTAIKRGMKQLYAEGHHNPFAGRKHSKATKAKMSAAQKGENSASWKGGIMRIKARNGNGHYIYVHSPDHPATAKSKWRQGHPYVAQHRLVMEAHLGRYLTDDEDVHHVNGIKDDNRLENLRLVTHNKHFGEVACPHCGKLFAVK
jgi:hypothetical protein